MPVKRTVASGEQRALFKKLAQVPIVVGAKSDTDQWSVNLHGNCLLFDKDWKTKETPRETLLAVRDRKAVPLTSSGEPRFHFHIDWTQVCWATLEVQKLDLIGTDRVVAFREDKEGARLFALYCLDKDIRAVMTVGESINLKPRKPLARR